MKPQRYEAAGGVVFDDQWVLVLERPARSEVRLPKGHIGDGESAREAALRETREETGYRDLTVDTDLGDMTVTFDLDGRSIERYERYFLMRLQSRATVPRPPKDAGQFRVRWLPAEQALERLTFDAERDWLRRALDARGGLAGSG